jgi:hypothetical protein
LFWAHPLRFITICLCCKSLTCNCFLY